MSSCNCIEEMDAKLASLNTKLQVTFGFPRAGGPTFILPTLGTKRVGPALAIPSFCPFCGNPYAPVPAEPAVTAFDGLRPDTHLVIERLLYDLHNGGEWNEEHEALLDQWRDARGDGAKGAWRWWVGYPNCESFGEDADSREQAIEIGKRSYVEEGSIEIVEARLWADNVKEGEDVSAFAESRNRDTIAIGGTEC